MASIFRRLRLGFGNRPDSYGPEKSWLPGIDFLAGGVVGTLLFNGTDWDVIVDGVTVGSIPGGGSGTVNVADSIDGDGSVGDPLTLVNDDASPGANQVYGTDGTGTKGWKPDPSGGGGGQVDSIVPGDGIAVDNTDPINPEVSAAISADANNILTFGTDGDLYVPAPTPATATFATLMRRSQLGSLPQNVNRLIVTAAPTTMAMGTMLRQTPDLRYCAWRINNPGNGASISVGLLQENSVSSQCGDNNVVNTNRTRSWGMIQSAGNWVRYHGSTSVYGAISVASGQVIVMYVNFLTGNVWWQINGVIPLAGNPATGANPAFTGINALCVPAATCALLAPTTNGDIEFDFTSASPFGATIASGYTAWNL